MNLESKSESKVHVESENQFRFWTSESEKKWSGMKPDTESESKGPAVNIIKSEWGPSGK